MKKYIITISREFGCGARSIAQEVARKLKIIMYDKDLIDMTAERAGMHLNSIEDMDKDIQEDTARQLLSQFSYGSSTSFYSDIAISVQEDVIRELADKNNSSLFFGRCSNYFLRDRDDTIDFFLYAPLEDRIRHISTEYKLDYRQAKKLIKRVDRQRHNYYKYVTGMSRGNRADNDLMVDVAAMGPSGTVNMIIDACKSKFGDEILNE